jgi:hypothetical protein
MEDYSNETNELVPYEDSAHGGLQLVGSVQGQLDQAAEAAKALRERVFSLVPPVKMNGRLYPLVEHWQTIGSFYGVVTRITSTEYVEFGDVRGWQATAEAVKVDTDQVVGRAEAMCLTDEPRWANKPLHQLRAMAQTRATGRVLRGLFARIMVLAGVEATPAEDASGDDAFGPDYERGQGRRRPAPAAAPPPPADNGFITEKQQKFLFAKARELGRTNDDVKAILERFGFTSTREIPKAKFNEILEALAG